MSISGERFRYNTSGKWFKGNTHIHTPASDGGTERAKITALYAGAGYDFAFCTDHWVASDLRKEAKKSSPLLWLDGIELDGRDDQAAYFHVVCLGRVTGLRREDNHVCHWLNGKSDGAVHWHAMLKRKPATLGLAADDAHLRAEHPGWNGGWIVVNAAARTADAILTAIRRGNYYFIS